MLLRISLCLLILIHVGYPGLADPPVYQVADSVKLERMLHLLDSLAANHPDHIVPWLDDALRHASSTADTTRTLSLMGRLGDQLKAEGNFDSARYWYEQALHLEQAHTYPEGASHWHDQLGRIYYQLGNYPRARSHFLERLQFCQQQGDSACISAISNNVGAALIGMGDYQEALVYTLQSLEMDEARQNTRGVLSSLMSLGNIHFHLENYDRSIAHYREIISIGEAMQGQELMMAYAYNNIASISYELHQFDSAILNYQKSLSLEKEFGNESGLAVKYNNLGSVYFAKGELDKAQNYYERALKLRTRAQDRYGMSSTENELGGLYLQRGDPKQALTHYQLGWQYAQEAGALTAAKIAGEGLANAYQALGQFERAAAYYQQALSLQDSLLTSEKTRQIAELEARYENRKKQNEIDLLRKNEEIQQARLAEQEAGLRESRLYRNALIAGLLVLGVVLILMVYTYRQRLAAKDLIQKNQEETDRMRRRFFASISHEFRTPLTLITAPVSDLMKQSEDASEQGKLHLIRQNADRLLRLVNQVMELSKLEAGKLALVVSKNDVVGWLRVIAADFESLAQSRQVNFDCMFPTEEIRFYFDAEKVEQMVINLLSNAFKFTPAGERVRLAVEQEGAWVCFRVSNTGTYIPAEDREKIFDRFYQSEAENQSQGTGIGLALVKELAELHHGRVDLEITETWVFFVIRLPMDDAVYEGDKKEETVTLPHKKQSVSGPDASFMPETPESTDELPLVLLAEDNNDLSMYIKSQLEGYRVAQAFNGQAALEIALKDIPDLVVTDLMMPEMTGEALLQSLRADPKTQHIPVIMLTARTEQERKLTNIEKGADHYLNKPFDMEELKVRMQSLLAQRRRIADFHRRQFLTEPQAEAIASSEDRFLQQVAKIVEEHLDNGEFTVDEFAKKLAVSRVQLHRKMKAILGCSASDFVREYRLKKAHEFLLHRKGSVSEIAYAVGFNNLSYFTKTFKEVYRVTPSQVLESSAKAG